MTHFSTSAPETIETQGIYLDEYEEIVKPGQLFLIPNYFIKYWVRRLGTTLSWVVISLQQACWRSESDCCTIAQATIAEEIGLERHTVARLLKDNAWAPWYIPQIEEQPGTVDRQEGIYYPSPRKYTIYLSTPLIPEHLAGLHTYLKNQAVETGPHQLDQALDQLLNMSSKEALLLLEKHAPAAGCAFEAPTSIRAVIEEVAGFSLDSVPPAVAKNLKIKASRLQNHLTDIGKTLCRQYFRLNWVPRLGPSLAWLVMIIRSRCFYDLSSGELRDTCTWRKKELVEMLGQSRNNLRNLLKNEDAAYFIQTAEQKRHSLTLRVALATEPLTTDSPEVFWRSQPANAQKPTMTPDSDAQKPTTTSPENAQKPTMTPVPNAQKSTVTSKERTEIFQDPASNAQKSTLFKYFEESVLLDDKIHEDSIPQVDDLNFSEKELRTLLSQAGLTGTGLNKLCDREPPFNLRYVQAVLLYAQAKGLGPGYIYRHLEREASVDPLFLELAALNDRILALFRQALAELTTNGGLSPPALQTSIPASMVNLFARFVEAFAGIEHEVVLATLRHHRQNEPGKMDAWSPSGLGPDVPRRQQPPPEDRELDRLWEQVLVQLEAQMTASTFNTWVRKTRLVAREGDHFIVTAQNHYAKDWLEHRLLSTIRRTLTRVLKEEPYTPLARIEIRFVVEGQPKKK